MQHDIAAAIALLWVAPGVGFCPPMRLMHRDMIVPGIVLMIVAAAIPQTARHIYQTALLDNFLIVTSNQTNVQPYPLIRGTTIQVSSNLTKTLGLIN